jgi:outer membrane protein
VQGFEYAATRLRQLADQFHKEESLTSINVLRVGAIGLGCFLAAGVLHAQNAATASVGPKVGVINMLQAISSTAEGKQASDQLQAQFAPRQQELESMTKQINDLQQRLNGGVSLSDDERARLNAQGGRLEREFERKKNAYQEDLNTAQGEAVNGIGTKMMEIVNRYALEQNYTEILDSSAQNSQLLYVAKNLDITQDIIRLYDQAHPLKSASAAPAAKPASALKPTAALATKP